MFFVQSSGGRIDRLLYLFQQIGETYGFGVGGFLEVVDRHVQVAFHLPNYTCLVFSDYAFVAIANIDHIAFGAFDIGLITFVYHGVSEDRVGSVDLLESSGKGRF